tara:strand:- start:170 stop:370 length:201 start_codon:yes stop_codon:yes gene_type:complete
MYSDRYKIRLPAEVLADLEEAAASPQACSVAPPKKRKHLEPFTGKTSKKTDPTIEEILATVQSPAN